MSVIIDRRYGEVIFFCPECKSDWTPPENRPQVPQRSGSPPDDIP